MHSSLASSRSIVRLLCAALTQLCLVGNGFAAAPADSTPDAYLVPVEVPRRALVLGNGQYSDLDPVTNAVNDADAVAAQLEGLHFTVIKRLNANRTGLFDAVEELASQVNEGDIVTIYYAGHGLESEHVNYLLPVESKQWPASRVPFETLPTSYIFDTVMLKRPSALILILDACREKPFSEETRGAERAGGLAAEEASTGVLIAFAAAPGSVAWSGSAQKVSSNSIYTAALVRYIRTPSMQIESVFKQVRSSVLHASKNQQQPWESTSLLGDIVLMPTPDDMERDRKVWIETLSTRDRDMIAAFPRQFPTSRYVDAARRWLASEQQEAVSKPFEPVWLSGNLESSSFVVGTQDFARAAFAAEGLSLMSTEDSSIEYHIDSGTPVQILNPPDEQGRTLIEASGMTGYITGVSIPAPRLRTDSKNEVIMYQANGALPDQINMTLGKIRESLEVSQSALDRILWQIDMQMPACERAKCAGAFTPRQLTWLNAIRLRSALAKQGTGAKSLIIRMPTSNSMQNALAVSGTIEVKP